MSSAVHKWSFPAEKFRPATLNSSDMTSSHLSPREDVTERAESGVSGSTHGLKPERVRIWLVDDSAEAVDAVRPRATPEASASARSVVICAGEAGKATMRARKPAFTIERVLGRHRGRLSHCHDARSNRKKPREGQELTWELYEWRDEVFRDKI